MAEPDSTLTRRCTSCFVHKPATLEFFPPHKIGRYGLHSWCIPCKRQIDTERRSRPDQQSRQKAWRDANKRYIKDYNQKYRDAGYKSTADVAKWRAANLEQVRDYERRKIRQRRAEDCWFKLKERMSSRIRYMIERTGGQKARRTTESLLGFSREELLRHIERQFTKGMTWEKLMLGEIHIDHIIPVAAFKPESIHCPEFKACWALANLRPMWAMDNFKKNAKVLTLL